LNQIAAVHRRRFAAQVSRELLFLFEQGKRQIAAPASHLLVFELLQFRYAFVAPTAPIAIDPKGKSREQINVQIRL
jgi:hypothetical protein